MQFVGISCSNLDGSVAGLTHGHFVNWMRIAGLPIFRKLYGKIEGDLPAGTQIRINFIDNYNIPGVEKKILIGNTSELGGKNEFIASFSLFSAIGSFALAVSLLILAARQQSSPEGGTKVISWA